MLVFSVDPQASLSDIFKRDIFGKGPVEIMPNLYAQEIDADRRIKEYQEEIRQKILDMYGLDKVPEEIENYIQAAAAEPAMEESAIFDEVVDIVVGGKYDYYIYDLVPLGHALYYLSMASVYDSGLTRSPRCAPRWRSTRKVAAVMQRNKETEEDQILKELQYIKYRINTSSGILTDKQKTAFFFVLDPRGDDHPGHPEGGRAVRQVRRAVGGLHRQPRHPAGAGAAGHPRIPAQPPGDAAAATGARSTRCSASEVLARVPEFERDITGLPMIERMAEAMFGE